MIALCLFLLQLKRELMYLSIVIGTGCSGYCLLALSPQVSSLMDDFFFLFKVNHTFKNIFQIR